MGRVKLSADARQLLIAIMRRAPSTTMDEEGCVRGWIGGTLQQLCADLPMDVPRLRAAIEELHAAGHLRVTTLGSRTRH